MRLILYWLWMAGITLNPLFMLALATLAALEGHHMLLALALISIGLLVAYPTRVGQVWAHPLAAVVGVVALFVAPILAVPLTGVILAISFFFSPAPSENLLDDVAAFLAPAAGALLADGDSYPWYTLEVAFSPPTGKLTAFLHVPGLKDRHMEGQQLSALAQKHFAHALPTINTFTYSTKRFTYTKPSAHTLMEGHERLAS